MDCYHGDDFLFCDLCGTMLSLELQKFAICNSCGFKRSMKEIKGKEIRYIITAEDIRRELNIEPFVKVTAFPTEVEMIRPTAQEACPKCGNPELTYTTKQLRSADEGQTIFYDCKKCGHKFSVNT